MSEDEQEAQSLRYADSIRVLPLSSGRIALLGPRCELHKIVDNWAEVLDNVSELRTAYKYVEPKNDRLDYRRSLGLPNTFKIDVDL